MDHETNTYKNPIRQKKQNRWGDEFISREIVHGIMANTAIPYDPSHFDMVNSIIELRILLAIIMALLILYSIYRFIVDPTGEDESPENIINEPIKKERTPAQQEYYDMFGKDWDEE